MSTKDSDRAFSPRRTPAGKSEHSTRVGRFVLAAVLIAATIPSPVFSRLGEDTGETPSSTGKESALAESEIAAVLAGNGHAGHSIFASAAQTMKVCYYADAKLINTYAALCVESASLETSGMTESPLDSLSSFVVKGPTAPMIDATR